MLVYQALLKLEALLSMRKFECFWRRDRQWYYYDGFVPVIREDAPDEVKASFERYKQQKRELYAEKSSKEAKYKRDPRIDGEYDPPLPPRKEHLTDEDERELRSMLLNYKARATAAGRSTAIYNEMERELDALFPKKKPEMMVSQEFLDDMIAEAGQRFKNAILGMAKEGWTEEQIRDWVNSL